MDVSEAVAQGAATFADAEDSARKIKKTFRDLRSVFEAIRDGGHIGSLECQALSGDADALATKFEADVWAMHAHLTRRCEALGIELPQPRSGGGNR